MIRYFVVDDVSGRIIRTGGCHMDDLDMQAEPGQTVYVGAASDTKHYVSGGALLDRPEMDVILDNNNPQVDELVTFSNIPVGTLINDGFSEWLIDDPEDTSLIWSSSEPKRFFFRFFNFPYQDLMIRVEVQE